MESKLNAQGLQLLGLCRAESRLLWLPFSSPRMTVTLGGAGTKGQGCVTALQLGAAAAVVL